jgi:uncharacterized protein with HEPN domain
METRRSASPWSVPWRSLAKPPTLIGEATRERHPGIDWRRITRFRILLAHHYHRVDPDQVWTIAADDIPALAKALGPLGPSEGE